jgi:hypothetical protein
MSTSNGYEGGYRGGEICRDLKKTTMMGDGWDGIWDVRRFPPPPGLNAQSLLTEAIDRPPLTYLVRHEGHGGHIRSTKVYNNNIYIIKVDIDYINITSLGV